MGSALRISCAHYICGAGLASSHSPTHIPSMDDVRTQWNRIHRNLRQITWMMAATIVLEVIVLVKVFSQ